MTISFEDVFHTAMGQRVNPYPYQTALAQGQWPDIVKIPTGMGKTAGIILSWLHKRLQCDPDTPRRLVYCLPMRVLVEQTARNANRWVDTLVTSGILATDKRPSVYTLMGGEIDRDWDRYPERDAILIGTQDQLLSRALNRGYAMSRFRWPVQFGLLNNDCIWVMDEIQLMGAGLPTTAQLQAFRNSLGTIHPVRSVWMSATLQKDWLDTIDFSHMMDSLYEFELSTDDLNNPSVKKRVKAKKAFELADCPAHNLKKVADTVLEAHRKGTRTLVIVNTVKRATGVYQELKKKNAGATLTLVHSRFRSEDRQKSLEKLLASPGREGSICISTQVVEAGVDVSATTLITDLAPWASMVQRFGRCNREGLDKNAKVICLNIDTSKKGAALPYEEEELKQTSRILDGMPDVGPVNLPQVSSEHKHNHILRRKDIIDLFDTTPDLSGMDVDISRFIRDSDDHDVYVFWRDIQKDHYPENDEASPLRHELCSVPVNDLRGLGDMDKWRWDHLEKRWERPRSISPGMILMLRLSDGCYNPEIGWTGNSQDIPEIAETGKVTEESNDDDRYVSTGWQTLAEHTEAVVKALKGILAECALSEDMWEEALLLAARWHDVGKAHEIFQSAMLGDPPEADASVIWAKTGRVNVTYARRGFRHELASALAMIDNDLPDLAAYLAAAHHGKVRLSIRSLPYEKSPGNPDTRFARGIWEGDMLQEADLGGGYTALQTALDLSYMEFGEGEKGPSWLARTLALRDDADLGSFRLAFLEALLRTADWRASENTEEKHA